MRTTKKKYETDRLTDLIRAQGRSLEVILKNIAKLTEDVESMKTTRSEYAMTLGGVDRFRAMGKLGLEPLLRFRYLVGRYTGGELERFLEPAVLERSASRVHANALGAIPSGAVG